MNFEQKNALVTMIRDYGTTNRLIIDAGHIEGGESTARMWREKAQEELQAIIALVDTLKAA